MLIAENGSALGLRVIVGVGKTKLLKRATLLQMS